MQHKNRIIDSIYAISPDISNFLAEFYVSDNNTAAGILNMELERQLSACDDYAHPFMEEADIITDHTIQALRKVLEIYPSAEEEIMISLRFAFGSHSY